VLHQHQNQVKKQMTDKRQSIYPGGGVFSSPGKLQHFGPKKKSRTKPRTQNVVTSRRQALTGRARWGANVGGGRP